MPTGYQIENQSACYFLTLLVVDWVDVFTRQRYRDIIIDSLKFCRQNKGLEIYAFVIMSNHMHLVVRSSNGCLSDTIRDFKSYTAKKILNSIESEKESRRNWLLRHFKSAALKHKRNAEYQLWTHENHAKELFSNHFIDQKINYIHQNPVKAGIVLRPEEYLYSSAPFFAGRDFLLECDEA